MARTANAAAEAVNETVLSTVEVAKAKMAAELRDTAANLTNSMMMALRKEAGKQGIGSVFYDETADTDGLREIIFAKTYDLLIKDAAAKLAKALAGDGTKN